MTTINSSNYTRHVAQSTLSCTKQGPIAIPDNPRKDKSPTAPRLIALRAYAFNVGRPGGILCLALLTILTCASVERAGAQSTFGSLRGAAQDSTGSAIPGAAIKLVGLDDNSEHKTISGGDGSFEFQNLKPGRYQVLGQAPGFADAKAPQVALEARQDLRITLTFGITGQTQTVEVLAGGEQINTENGTIGSTVSNEELTQLPMNSRAVSSSPLAGLALSPSVVTDSQGNIAVGGATSSQVGFSVDGISTSNVRSNGALHDAYPSSEGISETKVTAFNNNAEFAQIGDVTFTTKNGTNKWHGSAFEYF